MNRIFLFALITIGCSLGAYMLFLFKPWCIAWYLDLPMPKDRIVVEHDNMVKMKDGIHLATDVYLPKTKEKYPVIIMKTAAI
jgi:predicted acyl esterase